MIMSHILVFQHESVLYFIWFCRSVPKQMLNGSNFYASCIFLQWHIHISYSLTIMSNRILYARTQLQLETSEQCDTHLISGSTYFSTWRESCGLSRIRRPCVDEDSASYGKPCDRRVGGKRVGRIEVVVGRLDAYLRGKCVVGETMKARVPGVQEREGFLLFL